MKTQSRIMTFCHCLLFIGRCFQIKSSFLLKIIDFSQLVNVTTYAYFTLALVGYQDLEDDEGHVDVYFPFFLVLRFILFIGLLKVRTV